MPPPHYVTKQVSSAHSLLDTEGLNASKAQNSSIIQWQTIKA